MSTELFSGERQLICIAEAILRNSKIMFLDKVRASIDHALTSCLEDHPTTLYEPIVRSIGQRLNTIIGYDCIFVLNDAQIKDSSTT
jgi:ABC-type multidrug transport system fused ATPase/permease subunit